MASSSDSDSSVDEDFQKLKEAAIDSSFFRSGCPNGDAKQPSKTSLQQASGLPSLRPDKEQIDDANENVLQTTPGFRKHVAKKLSHVLDRDVDTSGVCFCPRNSVGTSVQPEGVKLLSGSKQFLGTTPLPQSSAKDHRRKRPPSSSSDSSCEDERLAEASVSYDFVFSQSQTPAFNQKQPDVVVITANGDTAPSGSNENKTVAKVVNPDLSCHIGQIDQGDEHKKKKKKKKKKHKQDDEIR